MSSGLTKALKARYKFDRWKDSGDAGEQLFLMNFRVSGDELPNKLLSTRVARTAPGKRVNTSTWSTEVAGEDRPVVVDVLEYPSSEDAKQALLELTGQFHRPVEISVDAGDVGDVRFVTPDNALFAFTRGNVLVRIVSPNGLTTPTRPIAEQIDRNLTSKPAEAVSVAAPGEAAGVAREAAPVMADVELGLQTATDLDEEQKPFIKIFSTGGKVKLEGDTVVPDSSAELEVYRQLPESQWTQRKIKPIPVPES